MAIMLEALAELVAVEVKVIYAVLVKVMVKNLLTSCRLSAEKINSNARLKQAYYFQLGVVNHN